MKLQLQDTMAAIGSFRPILLEIRGIAPLKARLWSGNINHSTLQRGEKLPPATECDPPPPSSEKCEKIRYCSFEM